MLLQAIAIYCVCDEVIQCVSYEDNSQSKLSTAEVLAFAVIAAIVYSGDYRKCRLATMGLRLFPNMLSLSRIVRRIHQVPDEIWGCVFTILGQIMARGKVRKCFIVDSFPLITYQNHRSFKAKIFHGKPYHGYSCTRKCFFFGLKVHMVVDLDGVPIEFTITPASISDIKGLRQLPLNLPKGSVLIGDAAYTDYAFEDRLSVVEGIHLIPKRQKKHSRKNCAEELALLQFRNRIETVFSSILGRMPRHLKARTEKGFVLKLFLFILAYMFNRSFPLV
jgi:hypothetical protein